MLPAFCPKPGEVDVSNGCATTITTCGRNITDETGEHAISRCSQTCFIFIKTTGYLSKSVLRITCKQQTTCGRNITYETCEQQVSTVMQADAACEEMNSSGHLLGDGVALAQLYPWSAWHFCFFTSTYPIRLLKLFCKQQTANRIWNKAHTMLLVSLLPLLCCMTCRCMLHQHKRSRHLHQPSAAGCLQRHLEQGSALQQR